MYVTPYVHKINRIKNKFYKNWKIGYKVVMFNTTFNTISVMLWRFVAYRLLESRYDRNCNSLTHLKRTLHTFVDGVING
jgi:hypothetical protein